MPKTILIAAFEGWNDASQAATNVVRHLVSRYESQEVRHIDNEGFYDYQVARPMICSVQGRKRIIWPQTTFYDIAVSPMLHLLAQIAPEPNYRWEEYCRQTLRVAEVIKYKTMCCNPLCLYGLSALLRILTEKALRFLEALFVPAGKET